MDDGTDEASRDRSASDGAMAAGGPSSHSKLWAGYIMKCGASDDVVPRVPRQYPEPLAIKIMMDMLRDKVCMLRCGAFVL